MTESTFFIYSPTFFYVLAHDFPDHHVHSYRFTGMRIVWHILHDKGRFENV